MKGWNHDRSPEQSIRFEPYMAEVRSNAGTPGYFESILREWILDNPHWTLVTVQPDTEMAGRQEKALKEELAALKAGMSEEDHKSLDEKNRSLAEFQEKEDEGKVPFLHRSDIPEEIKLLDSRLEALDEAVLITQGVFTNGILYNDMAFSLKHLDESLYPFLPLFTKLLSGTGLPGIPYDRVTREISLKTGGFGASVEAGHKVNDSPRQQPEAFLYIRLKMLENQRQEALELASSLLLNADFDNHTRLEQILAELWNDLKSSLVPGGHSYAMLRANSRFSSSARLEDMMFGIGQVQFLEKLVKLGRWQELSSLMKEIRNRIFTRSGLTLSLTMDDSVLKDQVPVISSFWINQLPGSPETGSPADPFGKELEVPPPVTGKSVAEGLAIQSSVGFVAKTIRGASMTEPEGASQSLLSHLLKTGPLWEKIRMKGGAYGAFSSLSGLDRVFSFGTYRDPEIEKSLVAFRESLEEFGDFDDEGELEKSLISVVGKEMKPLSPSEKSMIALKRFLYEITDELRQKKRDELMSCRCEDIRSASRRLLDRWEEDSVVVMSHPDKLDGAAAVYPGLKENRVDLPQ